MSKVRTTVWGAFFVLLQCKFLLVAWIKTGVQSKIFESLTLYLSKGNLSSRPIR